MDENLYFIIAISISNCIANNHKEDNMDVLVLSVLHIASIAFFLSVNRYEH